MAGLTVYLSMMLVLLVTCLVVFATNAQWPVLDGASSQRLEAMEERQRGIETEMVRMNNLNEMQTSISAELARALELMRSKESGMQRIIAGLASKVDKLQTQMTDQKRHVQQVTDRLDECKCAAPTTNSSNRSLSRTARVSADSGRNRHCSQARRQVTGTTAFTVYNDQGMLPSPGEIIPFNKVITNEGDAYDVDTGVFTCPQDGLYLFTVTVGEVGVNFIWADLMVQGVESVEAAAETFHDGQDLQGASTAVLRLQTGALVWVAAAKLTGQHIPSGGRLTSFSGVYLHD